MSRVLLLYVVGLMNFYLLSVLRKVFYLKNAAVLSSQVLAQLIVELAQH